VAGKGPPGARASGGKSAGVEAGERTGGGVSPEQPIQPNAVRLASAAAIGE
jgi:hypothetical protein